MRLVNNSGKLVLAIATAAVFSASLFSTSSLAERTKPYDRSKWYTPETETSDDLRRVPQSKGYRDHDGKLVLVGGRLFDGTGAAARPATIVTQGRAISAILEPGDTRYPAGADVVDISGKTVMPGLIDMHVHTTYVKHFGESPELTSESQADAALRGAERLRYYLESGVTSIRDVASHGMAPFILGQYIKDGNIPGPRIFAAGQLIAARGGHGTEGYGLKTAPKYPNAAIVEASGADEWRQAVRTQFKNGADLIKLSSHFSPEEVKAAIDEAHRLGLRVTVDAETQFIEMAVDAGADCIEHPLPRSDETIRKMKKYGVASVPTLVPYQFINSEGGYMGSTSRRFTLTNDSIMAMMKKMKDAGIKLGVATDLTVSLYKTMPGPYIKELNNFIAIGYSPADALVAATKTNAEILGMDDRLGTIEVGKLADIIVVNGKPDQKVEELANVDDVIINGKFQVKDGRIFIPRHRPEKMPGQ